MIEVQKAVYHDLNVEEFIGNPFLEALPEECDPDKYPELLFVMPPYDEADRKRPARERLQLLQRISQIHVPTTADTAIMINLRRCLNWGYVSRNPLKWPEIKMRLEMCHVKITDDLKKYIERPHPPVYGFPILGVSGVGKTTSVDNILGLYPQVIEHQKYFGLDLNETQVVWLKVDCPGDGTPKGLCHSIVNSLGIALNQNFKGSVIKNRMSKDLLTTEVTHLLNKYHLGVLLIDDIQNLISAKATVSQELLSFLIYLTGMVKAPIITIDTPKILKLHQKEFQLAKRATGESEVRLDPLKEGSQEWKWFIEVLWRFQLTKNKVPLTPELEHAIFEESAGNQFLAAILYKIVQDEAIINLSETFDVATIHQVAAKKLGLTAKMRKDLYEGKDVEFNTIMALWSAISPQEDVQGQPQIFTGPAKGDLQSQLTQAVAKQHSELGMLDARKLARQAIAALPDETDVDKLYAYAAQLLKKADKN